MGSVIDREDVQAALKYMGYAPSEEGFKKCIKESLKMMPMSELARQLNISKEGLRDWMKRFGLKNPNKPGGNNNPEGCYGKKGTRRNIKDGYISKEDRKRV